MSKALEEGGVRYKAVALGLQTDHRTGLHNMIRLLNEAHLQMRCIHRLGSMPEAGEVLTVCWHVRHACM